VRGAEILKPLSDYRRALLKKSALLVVEIHGTRSSAVGSGTMLQAGLSRVGFPMRSLHFSVFLTLPAALGPRDYSASSRNEYQESSWEQRLAHA
jgi:hypothetical protein